MAEKPAYRTFGRVQGWLGRNCRVADYSSTLMTAHRSALNGIPGPPAAPRYLSGCLDERPNQGLWRPIDQLVIRIRIPRSLGPNTVRELACSGEETYPNAQSQLNRKFEIPSIFMIRLAFPKVGTGENPREVLAGCHRRRIRVRPTTVPPYRKKSQVQWV